jgi:hypothetical protein
VTRNHYETSSQSDHIYYTLFCRCTPLLSLWPATANCAIMLSQNHFPFPWGKATYFEFSSFQFTEQDHMLSTAGDADLYSGHSESWPFDDVELDMATWTWQLIAKATWESGCGLSYQFWQSELWQTRSKITEQMVLHNEAVWNAELHYLQSFMCWLVSLPAEMSYYTVSFCPITSSFLLFFLLLLPFFSSIVPPTFGYILGFLCLTAGRRHHHGENNNSQVRWCCKNY